MTIIIDEEFGLDGKNGVYPDQVEPWPKRMFLKVRMILIHSYKQEPLNRMKRDLCSVVPSLKVSWLSI